MQCAQIRKMLANYALDDARVTERLCVDVHVAHCAACRRELEEVCEVIAASDRALSHPCPSADFESLMARIEAGEIRAREIPVATRWNWRTVAMRVAAAAVVVVVVAVTAPVARNARHVVRELRDVSSDRALPEDDRVQVPAVSEPFVKRALDIAEEGREPVQPIAPDEVEKDR